MSEASDAPRTIREIIKDAGGPAAISKAAKAADGSITVDAIYKWPQIGIPDRHWPIVMPLASATAEEMLAANVAARAPQETAA